MKLWIVFRWLIYPGVDYPECVGVFDSSENAEAACLTANYAVCPAVLNEKVDRVRDHIFHWPGAWFPKIPHASTPELLAGIYERELVAHVGGGT